MANEIVNAAPMVYSRGIQDLSTRALAREPEARPIHLPKFYLYTEKGPIEPQLVVGAERVRMYGEASFDLRSEYANHATVFANLANGEANSCMIQRLIPADAGPEANLTLWMDVIECNVTDYERNPDGTIKKNTSGQSIALEDTVEGCKVKFTVTNSNDAISTFGTKTSEEGTLTDGVTTSTKYPIMDLQVSSKGKWGNNVGIRMWAPTNATTIMPTKLMDAENAYPFNFAVVNKSSTTSNVSPVETQFGEQYFMFTFKEGSINPQTDAEMYLGDIMIDKYQNLVDLRYPKEFGDFGNIHLYQNNINTLLTLFATKESAIEDSTVSADKPYLFNFISGVDKDNIPYHTFTFVDDDSSVRLTQYTNLFAGGGSDGTMSDTLFAGLVKDEVEKYLDPDNELMETALNVESVIYDSGFPLDTKKALVAFTGVRKDTNVVLSTYEVGTPELTPSEEQSVGVALRTQMLMYPESDYFGTPVARGVISLGSGKLRNSQFKGRLPLSAEILIKSARFAGAGEGRFKSEYAFDSNPGNIIENMYDISIKSVSGTVRNKYWDAGLTWAQPYDRRSYFFPAIKTVYTDDTSVLNSYITMMICCELNKIAQKVWRNITGISSLTNGQLADRCNANVENEVKDKFANRVIIKPEATFTNFDVTSGYSWTLPIKLYAPNMKTVMTTYVQALRMDDYE